MKRWAALTIGLYVLCSVMLGSLICMLSIPLAPREKAAEAFGAFAFFSVAVVPVLALVQLALLLVPVARSQERPVGKRRVGIAAVLVAIPMAVIGQGSTGATDQEELRIGKQRIVHSGPGSAMRRAM